jgi:hypothetical protein
MVARLDDVSRIFLNVIYKSTIPANGKFDVEECWQVKPIGAKFMIG